MKLLPISLASLAVGAGLGVALAYVQVGTVEATLAPPPRAGEVDSLAIAREVPGAGPTVTFEEGPIADVDAATYDFGVMQRGATESHEFVFKNTGGSPLTLEVGRTSCKCTLGEVASAPLAPGESAPVRLEWVAKSLPGDFRQVATVLTNDPRQPTIELTVEGQVTETSGLVPEEFLLGRMAADETGTAAVVLSSYSEDPTASPLVAEALLDPSNDAAERFEFSVQRVEEADLPEGATSAVRIEVTAGSGLPIGSLTEWVTVRTNLVDGTPVGETPAGVELQVPLLAMVEGDISVHGAGWSKNRGLLNIGKVRSAEGKSAKLRISFKGDHADDLRAEVVSLDPEWLEVELDEPIPIREGVVHQPMTVRVPPGQAPVVRSGGGAENGGIGEGDGLIRLTTNHPTTSELDVKVRFVIAD